MMFALLAGSSMASQQIAALRQRPVALKPLHDYDLTTVAFGPDPQGFLLDNFTGRGTVTVKNDTMFLQGNDRAYQIKDYKEKQWSEIRYEKLNLLGKTLTWTADYSGVGCGCNAAVYLVGMGPDATATGSNYCDIQMKEDACLEIDLQEGNEKAIAATLHTQYEFKNASGPDSLADGVCNQWGCGVNWGRTNQTQYGRFQNRGIDSARPYTVSASWDADGHMTLKIVQDTREHLMWDKTTAYTPGGQKMNETEAIAVKAAMEEGMVLVISLWQSDGDGMAWLDGGCTDEYPHCDLANTRVSFTNFTVVDNCANGIWDQCGGVTGQSPFSGPTCCPSGSSCTKQDDFYSQCQPIIANA